MPTVKEGEPRDEELVFAARAGSERALERLVERYLGICYAIAFARLGHREMAEDVTQEVFLRVCLGLDKLKDPKLFSAWVSQIARNLALDRAREGQRLSRLVSMTPVGEIAEKVVDMNCESVRQRLEAEERMEILQKAILRLPVEQRELILLRFSEGFEAEEIAVKIGVHVTTVRRQLKRAVAAIKGGVETMLGEGAPYLRPSPRVAARTLAVVGAVSVMSAQSRSALAAAAGSIEVFAPALSTGGAGTAAGASGLLKTSPIAAGKIASAAIKRGLTASVRGKIAAWIAVAFIGSAGVYYYHRPEAAGMKSRIGGQTMTMTLGAPYIVKQGARTIVGCYSVYEGENEDWAGAAAAFNQRKHEIKNRKGNAVWWFLYKPHRDHPEVAASVKACFQGVEVADPSEVPAGMSATRFAAGDYVTIECQGATEAEAAGGVVPAIGVLDKWFKENGHERGEEGEGVIICNDDTLKPPPVRYFFSARIAN